MACNNKPINITGKTMGTTYSVKYIKQNNSISAKELQIQFAKYNKIFSSWDKNSQLSAINIAPVNKWLNVSDDMWQILNISMVIYHQTNGYFDVALGNLLRIWGHNEYFTNNNNKPKSSTIVAATKLSGSKFLLLNNRKIKKTRDIKLDLSAIAKGYTIDKLAELLLEKGIKNFIIELGGEVRANGRNNNKAWTIGINYADDKKPQAINLDNQAIASSGNYRNFIVYNNTKYGHILNPKTSTAATDNYVLVSVVAKSAAIADAYATALSAMNRKTADKFAKDNKLKAVFIAKDNDNFKIYKTF